MSLLPHLLFFLQDDLGHYNVAFNADRTDLPSEDVRNVSYRPSGALVES